MACVFVYKVVGDQYLQWKWYPFVLWGSCVWCVRAVLLLLCPLYNPFGVVLLSFCVWTRCIPWSRSLDFVLYRYSLLPTGHYL